MSYYKYKMKKYYLLIVALICLVNLAFSQTNKWDFLFKDPPAQFKPMPLWHLNGQLSDTVIDRQMNDVKYASKFGGVTVLPLSGTTPKYLSQDYWNFFGRILQDAKKLNLNVIWYDDVDYPSGSAGGEFKKAYPDDVRKILTKKDSVITGNTIIKMSVPCGKLMSAIAMNTTSKARIDIRPFVNNRLLKWKSPAGEWKVMTFTCDVASPKRGEDDLRVDYLDPQAVEKYVNLNYGQFAERFKSYFGTTIHRIFFDDVGFYTGIKYGERMWTLGFNEKFKTLYGVDPAMYYPALWEDIGPETSSARITLFNTRAELLSAGFPKVVTDWCNKNGLESMGHPPGNYEIQPVDMNGDVFKFYRHQAIPLMDLIFYHGHGREGYKLISSAANSEDKKIVAAEIYGAIGMGIGGAAGKVKFNSEMLYQCAMELFSRGVNFLIPHAMWLNPDSNAIYIPPLISAYSKEIGPELPKYNDWAGRTSMMLQGGKTVADIAIFYPIASLEAWFRFGMDKEWGKYVAPGTDYLAIGDMLTNQLHRDFTFIHPESLTNNKIKLEGEYMVLNNAVDQQRYKLLILPGGEVISLKALQKIRKFYDNGGSIIATSVLPSKSAESGMDQEVIKIKNELFDTTGKLKTNVKKGQTIFLLKPNANVLAQTFKDMAIHADVTFEGNPQPLTANGMLSYIHKVREGKDIYFFSNSTDDTVNTFVQVRGKIIPQLWNPYNGTISRINNVSYLKEGRRVYTRFPLKLGAVQSTFIIAKSIGKEDQMNRFVFEMDTHRTYFINIIITFNSI